jgi:hypothetical protein
LRENALSFIHLYSFEKENMLEGLPREYDVIVIGTGMKNILYEVEKKNLSFRHGREYCRCCLYSHWKDSASY